MRVLRFLSPGLALKKVVFYNVVLVIFVIFIVYFVALNAFVRKSDEQSKSFMKSRSGMSLFDGSGQRPANSVDSWITGNNLNKSGFKFLKHELLSMAPVNISLYPRRPPYVSGMRSPCVAFDEHGMALQNVSYNDLDDKQKTDLYCLPAFMIIGKTCLYCLPAFTIIGKADLYCLPSVVIIGKIDLC